MWLAPICLIGHQNCCKKSTPNFCNTRFWSSKISKIWLFKSSEFSHNNLESFTPISRALHTILITLMSMSCPTFQMAQNFLKSQPRNFSIATCRGEKHFINASFTKIDLLKKNTYLPSGIHFHRSSLSCAPLSRRQWGVKCAIVWLPDHTLLEYVV